MRRHLIAALAVLAGAIGLAPARVAQAATVPPTACTGIISIDRLAFNPPSIPAGSSSVANLVARNCTTQAQRVFITWVGRYISPAGPGIPPGCPAIDPLQLIGNFAPGSVVSTSVVYSVFHSCTATLLRLTVTITGNGQILASRSADLQITH